VTGALASTVKKGRFITLEGGEGAGKSTQIRLVADALMACGLDVVITREPGGSSGAEDIRELLVSGDPGRWGPMTEALLHTAARRDHLERTVWPALDAGRWVISDRFADSTIAYQGYGHGLKVTELERLYALTIGSFQADLTIILDIVPEEGMARARARRHHEDRYERMDLSFHHRLRQGFWEIARRHPTRCVLVEAGHPVEAVQAAILDAITHRLGVPAP